MTKLEIYVKILNLVLPYVRSIQSQNAWVKSQDISCYFEIELIHNLPKSILDKEISESDIWFLNTQAKYYFENCNEDISLNYNENIKHIRCLFNIVPDRLRPMLLWNGP